MKIVYGITPEQMAYEDMLEKTQRLLDMGLDMLQYRAKAKSAGRMAREIDGLLRLCSTCGVPLLVNDHVDLALELGCDGVHAGQSDEGTGAIRQRTGTGFIIGATAKSLESALMAQASGASYLGVGALYPSSTKPEAVSVSGEILRAIHDSVSLPVYAIGGLSPERIDGELLSMADGVVLSAALYDNTGNLALIKKKMERLEKGI